MYIRMLLLLLLVPCIVAAQHLDGEKIFDAYADAVVLIEAYDDTSVSRGSGFFINDEGCILTNRHVVEGKKVSNIIVTLRNKQRLRTVDIIEEFPHLDMAILQVQHRSNTYIPILPEGDAVVGEEVAAIGHPLGLEWSLTSGRISKVDFVGHEKLKTLFQLETPLNRGNSGGPVINRKGYVVGIATRAGNPALIQNINFAVKAGWIRDVLSSRKTNYYSVSHISTSLDDYERSLSLVRQERADISLAREDFEREKRNFEQNRKNKESELENARNTLERKKSESAQLIAKGDEFRRWEIRLEMRERQANEAEAELARRERSLALSLQEFQRNRELAAYLTPKRFALEASLSGGRILREKSSFYGLSGSVGILYRIGIDRRSYETSQNPTDRVGLVFSYHGVDMNMPTRFNDMSDIMLVYDIDERIRLGLGKGTTSYFTRQLGNTMYTASLSYFINRYPVPISMNVRYYANETIRTGMMGIGASIGFGQYFIPW